MRGDIQTLLLWIRVFTVGAAICTTSVPVMYAFFPWRTRTLGRLFMLQAFAFALAMDISATFSLWRPKNIWFIFFADMGILTGIAAATLSLAIFMWRLNHPRKRGRHRDENRQQDVRHLEERGPNLPAGPGDPVRGSGSDLGTTGS